MGKYSNLIINTALFAVNAVATKLISFFLVPLYTTYLSVGEYGITDMSLTVIALLTPLVTLDISDATVRFIVGDRSREDKYAAVSLAVGGGSAVIVSLLTPVLDFGVFGGLGEFKGWFLLAYMSSVLMSLCGNIARGRGDIKLIPVCAAVSSLITLATAFVLIAQLGLGITGYFASVSAGPIAAITLYLTLGGIGSMALEGVRRLIGGGCAAIKRIASPMIRYSLPLVPNALFWWAGTSINRLFITGMLGISASGMFAAAGKVPNLINMAYSIFQQAWQLSAFQEAGEKDIARFYSSVFRIVQAGLTVLCSALSFFSPWLAFVLLRGETFDAWPMIPILLLANLMNVFNSFYGTVYTSTMHTSYVMRTTVFGAFSCTVFTPLLIPFLGTYGACIASAIGQGLVFVMRAQDSRKYIAFDAGWRRLVPVLVLLLLQAVLTASQFPGWRLISSLFLAAIIAIQGPSLFRAAELLIRRLQQDDR